MSTCTKCHHENRPQAQFCEDCGAALTRSCTSCGNQLRDRAKFCDQCGTAVETPPAAEPPAPPERNPRDYTPKHLADRVLNSRSALEGERKHVTVLFADIKGSQALAEDVDPELWHQLLDRYFGILAEEIHKWDGTINQYTGDGVMALFGAPIAHEDHAVRACHAALALNKRLRTFGDELRLKHALNFSTRIGMNSGEVIVGRIGDDLRMDYTAQGHTVGLAARMESIAEPGSAYLTRYTAAMVDGYFKLRDLGEMDVKGSINPVQVYQLLDTGPLMARLDLSASRGLSSFLGREREIAILNDALEKTLVGHGQIVAVIGDAGIGKSRLCYEFTEHCIRKNIHVHRATGVPYGRSVPFLPVVTLLKSHFDIADDASPADARRQIAGGLMLAGTDCRDAMALMFEFMGVAESNAEPIDMPPEQRQSILVNVFRTLCLNGHGQPTVILLEDLHWLDPASDEFFCSAFNDIHDKGVMLIVNYRPDYENKALEAELGQRIRLAPLNETTIRRLATEWIGGSKDLAALIERIASQAAGNPYFVEEAVRHLHETGGITGERGGFSITKQAAKLTIPPTVQGILAGRIDRLDETAKLVLQTAAVIGKTFQLCQLEPLLGGMNPAVNLSTLIKRRFIDIQERGHDCEEYDFAHPLIQEVAYQSQLGERRATIHALLAAQLEAGLENPERPGRDAILIAHHWKHAGKPINASDWYMKALVWSGDQSLAECLQYCNTVIELLDKEPVDERVRRLLISALSGIIRLSAFTSVDSDHVQQSYERARDLAKQANDKSGLAEILISRSASLINEADSDFVLKTAVEALELGEEIGNGELIGRFRVGVLIAYYGAGRSAEGLARLDRSCADWQTRPIDNDNFASRAFRGFMLSSMGQLDDAEHDLRGALEVSERSGRVVSWLYANLVDWASFSGVTDEAMKHARAAVDRAETFGSPFFKSIAYRALGMAQTMQHDWNGAIETLASDAAMGTDGDQPYRIPVLAFLADALNGAGKPDEAVESAREAVRVAEVTNARSWNVHARITLARSLRRLHGTKAEAEIIEQFKLAKLGIEQTGHQGMTPFLLWEQAKLALMTSDEAAYRSAMSATFDAFARNGARGYLTRLNALFDRDNQTDIIV